MDFRFTKFQDWLLKKLHTCEVCGHSVRFSSAWDSILHTPDPYSRSSTLEHECRVKGCFCTIPHNKLLEGLLKQYRKEQKEKRKIIIRETVVIVIKDKDIEVKDSVLQKGKMMDNYRERSCKTCDEPCLVR